MTLENAVLGVGAIHSVKRILRIGDRYVITAVHGATPHELVHQTLNVMVQFPDSHLPHGVLAIEGILQSGEHLGERMYLHARLQHLPGAAICICKAYRWPHRKGSGSCYQLHAAPFCNDCGKSCTPVETAVNPIRKLWSSHCCGAYMSLDCELKEPYLIGDD